ncbi:hypothetical protein PTH_1675 [Pelotomaculum thermopropionicum SI]|uniref:Uncharacterized protein n=1 Tax=Pelotomaculum thermopropionicum (strain DSM 13744 / JCM 10971 / SI) TaxID=370438 RepID=A5D1L9_PELTS|nr:hypothetical protein PTH_1675 [Pelotomaculum thermopropionicum SI]
MPFVFYVVFYSQTLPVHSSAANSSGSPEEIIASAAL